METLVSRDQHKTWLKADTYMSYYAHMYAILSFDSFWLKFDPLTWIIIWKVEIDLSEKNWVKCHLNFHNMEKVA